MATHSSTLAWKIPWTEEPGGLQSMGLLRVGQTERLHFHFSLSCIGEGNGNPLQRSCLENPRYGGAWWAAIYGVTQSRTWLKRLSSSSSRLLWVFVALGGLSPVALRRGYFVAVCGLLIAMASLAEHRLSSCGEQAELFMWQVKASGTRDGTRVPCIGRQILIYCTTREVLELVSCCLSKISTIKLNWPKSDRLHFNRLYLMYEIAPFTNFFNEILLLTYIYKFNTAAAATAAKSLQSCLTLCDPIDGSPPGSAVPGIL